MGLCGRKNAEYRDPKSSKALSKLNNNLQEVSNIMRLQISSFVLRFEAKHRRDLEER